MNPFNSCYEATKKSTIEFKKGNETAEAVFSGQHNICCLGTCKACNGPMTVTFYWQPRQLHTARAIGQQPYYVHKQAS